MMLFIVKDEQRRADAIEAIKMMSINKPMSIEIKEYRKNRTLSQNRLYWSWVNIIADHVGEIAENIHEAFKQKLLGTVRRKIMGDEYTIAKTTTGLSTTEFSEYMERVESIAKTLQIRLPYPDDILLAMGHDKD